MTAPKIRTAEVLGVFDAVPQTDLRQRDIAAALGVEARAISGHLDWLLRCGKLTRVARGVYRRTAWGAQAA